MKINYKFNKERFLLFLGLVSAFTIVVLIVSYTIFNNERKNAIDRIEKTETIKQNFQIKELYEEFNSIQQDVVFLRDFISLNHLSYSNNKNSFKELEKEFLIFLKQHKQYDQLRLIDHNGMELIRVQNISGKTVLVKHDSLQNKSNRNYFKDIKNLSYSDLYFSKFDLNIENEKIEIPHKPMIRIGMKIANNDDFSSIIIINYLGQSLINNLNSHNLNISSSLYLLDSRGYLFVSPDEYNNWGFMTEKGKDNLYSKFYPEPWEKIKTKKSGQFRDNYGIFTFNTISFSQFTQLLGTNTINYVSKDNYWKIVSLVSAKKILEINKPIASQFLYLLILIIILFVVLSYAIAYYTVKGKETRKQISNKNKFLFNVINSYSAPFYVLDVKTGIINLSNKSAYEIGIKEDTLFENNLLFSNKDDKEKIDDFRNEIIKSKEHQRIEIEENSGSNAVRYFEINGFPVINDKKEVVQIIEVINDKTVEKLSEKKFKDLLSSAPDGMVIVNSQAVIEMVNKQAEKLFQYSAKELIGKKIETLIPGRFTNHIKYRKNYIKDPHTRKMGGNSELLALKKNGEEFPIEVSLSPIQTIDGVLIASAIRDITDRKRVELELRKLALVAKYTNNSVIITDSQARVEWVNEAFERITEYKLSEIKGMTVGPILQGKDTSKESKQLLHDAVKNKEALKVEIINYKKSGEAFWQLLNIQPISSIDGSELKYIGLGIDISDLKQKEEEVHKLNEELEERVKDRTYKLEKATKAIIKNREELKKSNARLEFAFSSGGFSWWELDCSTGRISSSSLIKKILGYQLDGKEITLEWFMGIIHPKDLEIAKQNVKDLFSGRIDSYNIDYRLRHNNGKYKWFNAKGKSLTNGNKSKRIIGTIQDISLIKEAEEGIIKAKDAAESSNRAKSEFLANMSHEIRTPMNAIIGFSEQLSNTIKDNKQLSQINSIRSSGKNLLKIINDILDLSKIEAGKLEIYPTPISLIMVTSEVKEMFSQKIKDKGIKMHLHLSKELPETILLDEVRIRQILFNLIGNAIKFTEEGSVTLSIDSQKCEITENKVNITIVVKDTGIGIPIEQQRLIFDPFNQKIGQSVMKYGGTGLGLSITQKLVEKMGGSISVESEVGVGSSFKVILKNIPVSGIILNFENKAFDTSNVVFEPAKVLIVDDNIDNRKLILDLLDGSKLTILQAENGKQAVSIARKQIPDLILMDIRMPVMDGFEAAKILSEDKITSSIPVIAIAAYVKNIENKKNISGLFDEYILKPFDIESFFIKIRKYLKYEIIDKEVFTNYSKVEKSIKNELSEEQIKALPDFVKMLKHRFIPKYEKALKSQVINEIEQFGIDLLKVSEPMNCKILLEYCNKIAIYVSSFEFEKLNNTLKQFPKILETLNKYSL